jgi:hypothetical protein
VIFFFFFERWRQNFRSSFAKKREKKRCFSSTFFGTNLFEIMSAKRILKLEEDNAALQLQLKDQEEQRVKRQKMQEDDVAQLKQTLAALVAGQERLQQQLQLHSSSTRAQASSLGSTTSTSTNACTGVLSPLHLTLPPSPLTGNPPVSSPTAARTSSTNVSPMNTAQPDAIERDAQVASLVAALSVNKKKTNCFLGFNVQTLSLVFFFCFFCFFVIVSGYLKRRYTMVRRALKSNERCVRTPICLWLRAVNSTKTSLLRVISAVC